MVSDGFPNLPSKPKDSASKVGRPHVQSDEFLAGSFNFLVSALEKGWSRIGWTLARIRESREPQTLESVRRALAPLNGPQQGVICILVSEMVIEADSTELSRLRRRYEEDVKGKFGGRNATSLQLDLLREANRAVFQAATERRPILIAAKDRRAREFFRLRRIQGQFENRVNDLERELRPKEAFFAQTEALDFLRQRRYKLTPRDLAAALADLPNTHWETSLHRCTKIGCLVLEHPFYSVFRAVSYITKRERPPTAQEAITLFRERIPRLRATKKHDHAQGKSFLSSHFRQFRKAIEQEWNRCPNPRRLPYDLVSAFIGELDRPMTDEDRVLAAEQALPI